MNYPKLSFESQYFVCANQIHKLSRFCLVFISSFYIFFFSSRFLSPSADISQHRTVTAVYKYFGKSFLLYFSFSVCTHVPLFNCQSCTTLWNHSEMRTGVTYGTDKKFIITVNFLPRYRQLMYLWIPQYHLLLHGNHEVCSSDHLVPVHLSFYLNW